MLVQKLVDEYHVEVGAKPPTTPSNAGLVLVKGDGSRPLDEKATTEYQSAMATCMYMMRWSRPDIYNATR